MQEFLVNCQKGVECFRGIWEIVLDFGCTGNLLLFALFKLMGCRASLSKQLTHT